MNTQKQWEDIYKNHPCPNRTKGCNCRLWKAYGFSQYKKCLPMISKCPVYGDKYE